MILALIAWLVVSAHAVTSPCHMVNGIPDCGPSCKADMTNPKEAVNCATATLKPECGKEIIFNCDTHRLTINGHVSNLDCGAATGATEGVIGRATGGAGSLYGGLRNKPIILLMPPPGCDMVVHGWPVDHPVDRPGIEFGLGCIVPGPAQIDQIANCECTPFKVIHSGESSDQIANGHNGEGTNR